MASSFTTAGLGTVKGGGGEADNVARQQAWLAAHPGGAIGRDQPDQPGYTARWPGGTVAATAYASLGALMGRLDQAEAAGRCPVHGEAA